MEKAPHPAGRAGFRTLGRRGVWWLAVGALLAGCGEGRAVGARVAEVRYVLDWAGAPAAGWGGTTAAGVEVKVEEGRLGSYTVELLPCPVEAAAWTPDLFGGVAWAGHAMRLDPSAMRPGRSEALARPEATRVDPIGVPPATYCQVHYLVARPAKAHQGGLGTGDEAALSLVLRGTYRRPGEASPTPFEIKSAAATGRTFDLPRPLAPTEGPQVLTLTVRRDLGPLFEGVAFGAAKPAQIARQVLQNLIDHTRVEAAYRPLAPEATP